MHELIDLHRCGRAASRYRWEATEAAMASSFDDVYRRSIQDPEAFWGAAAEDLVWERRWDRIAGFAHSVK